MVCKYGLNALCARNTKACITDVSTGASFYVSPGAPPLLLRCPPDCLPLGQCRSSFQSGWCFISTRASGRGQSAFLYRLWYPCFRVYGPMDKALVYGTRDSRFDPWYTHLFGHFQAGGSCWAAGDHSYVRVLF